VEQTGLTETEYRTARELFADLFGRLQAIGRAPDGSSTRLAWSPEVAQAGQWFDAAAQRLGLAVSVDRNGNRWAWSAPGESTKAIVTGSHLDTVPRGGRFDGALGVVCGLIAASIVLSRGGSGKPLAVVSFADEEGGRFNTPTFGSRLLTGALAPEAVLERTDGRGVTLSAALSEAGVNPDELGHDDAVLERIDSFVELHVEQGRLLSELGRPLGIATSILPHGRWRVDLLGEANHGGTTAISARRDPMPALAELLQASRRLAEREDSLVTVGKLDVWPNAPTSIAERVSAWLDVRSERDGALDTIVGEIESTVRTVADRSGVEVRLQQESRTPEVRFSEALAARISRALAEAGLEPVPMSTGAGHDAGVLAARIPTAMLFVRNQTGVSHAAAELAAEEDCLTGIAALTAVLADLRGYESA
jgi:N-carbamoyl-L-amino-acid hydrolase